MRFALIVAPRFGTHLIRTALNEHPDICVSREILNPARSKYHKGLRALRNWWKMLHTEACVGTLLHRDLYWGPRSKEVEIWDDVGRRHERFVSVIRDNLLKAYLSRLVAMQVWNWSCVRVRTKKVTPIHMSPKGLTQFCVEFWSYYGKVDTRYSPRHVITYEEMCVDWVGSMAGVQKFLGVAIRPLPQVTYRQETRSLQESISNYSEIAKVIGDLGCARWLD